MLFICYVIAFHTIGYAVIIYGAYLYSVANKYGEADIYIGAAEPTMGDMLDVRVEQVVHADGVVDSLAVTIVGARAQGLWNQVRSLDDEVKEFEQTQTALSRFGARAGEPLSAEFEFELSQEMSPTTSPEARLKTPVNWRIEVKTELRDRFAYKRKAPLVVRPAVPQHGTSDGLA